jgi:hemagglutinin-like protein
MNTFPGIHPSGYAKHVKFFSRKNFRGKINANGQIVLVNPNGIFFGPTASVNVGGLIASGLNISTFDFLNGDYIFNEVVGSEGFVINRDAVNELSVYFCYIKTKDV